ncbi:MAG: hypothetical protein JNL74_18195 [Fibrobacteres bacterium]|nr:hypothetical protein [Fibrobacterota bacterium]
MAVSELFDFTDTGSIKELKGFEVQMDLCKTLDCSQLADINFIAFNDDTNVKDATTNNHLEVNFDSFIANHRRKKGDLNALDIASIITDGLSDTYNTDNAVIARRVVTDALGYIFAYGEESIKDSFAALYKSFKIEIMMWKMTRQTLSDEWIAFLERLEVLLGNTEIKPALEYIVTANPILYRRITKWIQEGCMKSAKVSVITDNMLNTK